MFDQVEQYCRPESVRDALRLLDRSKGHAQVVAGGTDLVVEGGLSVRVLIDLTRAGLTYIRRRESLCLIGATTTLSEIGQSTVIRGLAGGLLTQAATACGSVQIRNLATLGGNLAHGSPAADMTPALLALEASVVIANDKRHKMPLVDYLQRSPHMGHSLLVEVMVPEPPHGARTGWSFQKFGRTEVDISLVSVAAGLQLDARARVKWARLALGAVAPLPFRAGAVEQMMAGQLFDQTLLARVGEQITRDVQPISDLRATAEFRRELSRVVAGRALEACAAQAGLTL